MSYQPPPAYDYQTPHETPPPPQKSSVVGPLVGIGIVAAALFGKLKFLLPALKFLKLGKILTTSGTMLLSMWAYATVYGWTFGVGFVILIFIHEMGHVFVAWRQGLPISAPVFIPFMGAVIFQKRESDSAWDQAMMGIGGPIGGAIGALACHAIYLATGSPFFLGLAFIGYFFNLINLAPMIPLDGGWIVGAISPWLWLVGLVVMAALYVFDVVNNPIFIILALLSLPRLWHGLRNKGAPPGGVPATPPQRLAMGAMYLSLCAFLGWMMSIAHEDPRGLREEYEVPTEISGPA